MQANLSRLHAGWVALLLALNPTAARSAAPDALDRALSQVGGPFELVDQNGRPAPDQRFRGRWMLIFFGFASCPDICPTALGTLASALDWLGPAADRIQPLFITLDPRRDTPAALAAYTAAFDRRILGLTGTPAQVAAAARAYRVHASVHRTGPGPDDYTIDHPGTLWAVRPDGRFAATLDPGQGADGLAAALHQLIETASPARGR